MRRRAGSPSVGSSASASPGEGNGLSVGLGASADANLGLGGLGSSDTTDTGPIANAGGDASLISGDDLSQVIALIDASDWTETSLSGLSGIAATAYDVTSWINADNRAASANGYGEVSRRASTVEKPER